MPERVQSRELATLFSLATVVAIECNPDTLPACRAVAEADFRITLIERAVQEYTGRTAFYQIDRNKTVTSWPDGNPGASSLFKATGRYPIEDYKQCVIAVDCDRIDRICRQLQIDNIDLMWIDLQGAELLAFRSAGALMQNIRYIHTEVSFKPLYQGQCLYWEVDRFLRRNGFERCTPVDRNLWQQDVIYRNTRRFVDALVPVGPNDEELAPIAVRALRENIVNLRKIFVVGHRETSIPTTEPIKENSFPFCRDEIGKLLGVRERSGWYFQQLVKIYFLSVVKQALDDLLIVDADVIFLRKCTFIKRGRVRFPYSTENHSPYFAHMARLNRSLTRQCGVSGIAHCMVFTRRWVEQLMTMVEVSRGNQAPFWRVFLDAIDPTEASASAASEYEIYFNFVLQWFNRYVRIYPFLWKNISGSELTFPQSCDYVCCHWHSRTESFRSERHP